MIVTHSLPLFLAPSQPRWVYEALSCLLLFTKCATPLFIWIFGMTMAYVYFERIGDAGQAAKLRVRLWKRAGWVFLSREFLVLIVDLGEGRPTDDIIRQLLYVQTGAWVEVLNYYLILLLLGPWLLRAWRSAPNWLRMGALVALYGAGQALARIEVPAGWMALKNILVGYAAGAFGNEQMDTFPVFQLSSFYLGGLLWGEHLIKVMRARSWPLFLRVGAGTAAVSFALSFAWAGLSPDHYVTAIAYDQFKYPPTLPYVFYGVAGAMAVNVLWIWLLEIRGLDHPAFRLVETLGRNSLFIFNFQYVLLFVAGGMCLGLLNRQSAAGSLALTVGVVLACLAGAAVWDRKKRRAGSE